MSIFAILGQWKNDYKHGKGVFKYANGDVYEGMFEKGQRSGEGTYKFKKGPTVKGNYKNDVRLKDDVTTGTLPPTTTSEVHHQRDEDRSKHAMEESDE